MTALAEDYVAAATGFLSFLQTVVP